MKKYVLMPLCLLFLINLHLDAQPTDRPLENFHVDQQKQEMHYENVFTDSLDNASKIAGKLKRLLALDTNEISGLLFDSTYNMYFGRVKNLHIPYYSKGSGRELEGKFTIEIKNGRYKLTISDMFWQSNYLSFSTERVYLEDGNLNKKATAWQSMAFDVLPQLNLLFVDKFKLPVPVAGSTW